MVLINNYILLKTSQIFNDYMGSNPYYNPLHHINRWAEVVQLPEHLIYDINKPHITMFHKTEIEVNIGDEVLVNEVSLATALGTLTSDAKDDSDCYRQCYYKDGNDIYFYLRYSELFLSKDKMLNGNVLVKSIDEEHSFFGRTTKANLGIVVNVGSKNKEYLFGGKDADVSIGDIILFKKNQVLHEGNYIIKGKHIYANS